MGVWDPTVPKEKPPGVVGFGRSASDGVENTERSTRLEMAELRNFMVLSAMTFTQDYELS